MPIPIQFRRDIFSTWQGLDPTLLQGEPGFESDSGLFKIGDGSTPYNLLPYAGGPGSRSATCVIAANDAEAQSKNAADHVCSGTDDQDDIISIINSIAPNGGLVIFTEGTFNFSGPLLDGLVSNLYLRGYGQATQFLLLPGTNTQMINQTSISNVTFDNIHFNGNGQNQTDQVNRDALDIINMSGVEYLTIKDCYISNGRHGAQVRLSQCDFCTIYGNQAFGIGLNNGPNSCDAFFNRNSTGYRCWGNTIVGSTSAGQANPDTSFAQDGVTQSVIFGNTILTMNGGVSVSESTVESPSTAASSNNNIVANNIIQGQGGASGTSVGIKVSSYGNPGSGNMHDVTLIGNDILSCDRAMWLEQCDRLLVTNNHLHDAAGANKQLMILGTTGTMADLTIRDNKFYNTTNDGIQFVTNANTGNTIIQNNSFVSVATPIGGTLPTTGTVIRGNVGYNPTFISTPSFPATTTTYTNNTGVDLTAYVTNGAASMTTLLNGHAGPTLAASAANIAIFIPAGGTFTPTFASGSPSWVFQGN